MTKIQKLVRKICHFVCKHFKNIAKITGSVGGIRASVYNGMPVAGVEKLVAFMKAFQSENSA